MTLESSLETKSARLINKHEVVRTLADAAQVSTLIKSLGDKIKADCPDLSQLVLIGIHTGGAHIAHRIKFYLLDSNVEVLTGEIDITLYRDDLFDGLPRPHVGMTRLPCSMEGKWVVLIDDVLYTGRTIRSALYELMDFGRALCVRLAVLVDRGHRELPICADYFGLKTDAGQDETVRVRLLESGGQDEIVLLKRG